MREQEQNPWEDWSKSNLESLFLTSDEEALVSSFFEIRLRIWEGVSPKEDLYRFSAKVGQLQGELLDVPRVQQALRLVSLFFPTEVKP